MDRGAHCRPRRAGGRGMSARERDAAAAPARANGREVKPSLLASFSYKDWAVAAIGASCFASMFLLASESAPADDLAFVIVERRTCDPLFPPPARGAWQVVEPGR